MNRKPAWVLIVSLVSAGAALANAGPIPLPKGYKLVEPPVRFEGLDKHPDHVFYMYYGAVHSDYKLEELKDAEPIKLTFKRKDSQPSIYLEIIAIERNDFGKKKKADPSFKWLTDKKDGLILARPTPPEATVPVTQKEVPVTTYRLTLKDGKLTADKVATQKTGAAEPSGFMPPWIFGIVMSVSMSWLGLWFARRGSR